MFCTNCGSPIPDGDLFCTNCGAAVEADGAGGSDRPLSCPSCGAPLETSAAFCTSCGSPVAGSERTTVLDGGSRSPSDDPIDNIGTQPIGGFGADPAADRTVAAPFSAAAGQGTQQSPQSPGNTASYAAQAGSIPAKKRVSPAVWVAAGALAAVLVAGGVYAGLTLFGPDAAETSEDRSSDGSEKDGSEDTQASGGEEGSRSEDGSSDSSPESSTESEDGESSSDGGAPVNSQLVAEDTGSYILPESASRYYTADDLSQLSDYELYLARNEIYARRGREFNNLDLQDYFSWFSWYDPRYTPEEFDSSVTLNQYEQANAELIQQIEQERGSQWAS